MRSTLLIADEAFAISFQAVSFPTLTTPHLRCVKFVNLMSFHPFTPNEINSILSFVQVTLIVVAILANTVWPTYSIIMEARAVQF